MAVSDGTNDRNERKKKPSKIFERTSQNFRGTERALNRTKTLT